MKRFFSPVARGTGEGSSNKQQKPGGAAVAADQDPGVIATWNAQGILNRFKRKDDDLQHIRRFVETYQPDVFALQEVRTDEWMDLDMYVCVRHDQRFPSFALAGLASGG